MRKNKIRVGITIGDPSGIGPAVTVKAVNKLKGLADFTVIGDGGVFSQLAAAGYRLQVRSFLDLENVSHPKFKFGQIKAEYGRAAIEYLDKALELIKRGDIDCLVTAPISKEAINKAGFFYQGHTEYLSCAARAKDLVMMLLNKQLRFSLVTRHIPLKDVSSKISREQLYKTILLTHQALKKLFLIRSPRIGICGLNPHASDNGLIGNEENRVIKPVLRKLRNRFRMQIQDPLSADIAVYRMSLGEFDCAIAMYHDQALIPLKLLGRNSGVNITLGLPFIRTSPLHGTAFDIADNLSLANPDSLIEAIKLAVQCALNLKKN